MRSLYEFDAMVTPSEKEAKRRKSKDPYQDLVYTPGSTPEEAQAETVDFCVSAVFTGKVTPLSQDWQR
jgi:hypothetical protein